MKNTAIIGAQWGDEGKGKITHLLAKEADIVARFAGGGNAGHTIVFENNSYKLHHIPSGIFYPDKVCILGGGMVIDTDGLLNEIDELRKKNISVENLKISPNAHIVMPYHLYIDRQQEDTKGGKKLGTTCRGIGPAYTDKIARTGIRFCDLFDKKLVEEKVTNNLEGKKELLRESGLTKSIIIDNLMANFEKIKKYICDTSFLLDEMLKKDKKVMFEGAQGVLLDIDYGTYPFVTSSNAISGGITTGLGISPKYIEDIIGIVKAYSTRVGTGPFPTEIEGDEGNQLREKGAEYGTTTGRPRRCGHLDGLVLKFAVRVAGLDSIALTKLDVLTGMEKLKIAVSYNYNGETINEVPYSAGVFYACKPVYMELPGWVEDITHCRKYEDLPVNAKKYIEAIEDIIRVPAKIISVGPDEKETIKK